MKVLVTNDDGIKHPNIKALVQSLLKYFNKEDIYVFSPMTEQSAVSHRIEIKEHVRVVKTEAIVEGVETYMVSSTPADCVIYGVQLLNRGIDLVISGINDGLNLGLDVVYSGTVGAALEAKGQGITSLALSCDMKSIEGYLKNSDEFFKFYFSNNFKGTCLNVNFNSKSNKFIVTKQHINGIDDLDDVHFFNEGYTTITPLENDLTKVEDIEFIQGRLIANSLAKNIK